MLDLFSTTQGIDEEAARCANLLTAVIIHAIHDAGSPATQEEVHKKRNIRPEPRQAIEWLFEPHTPFEVYANLIGADAQTIRDALLSRTLNTATARHHFFTDSHRRALKARYDWYLQAKRMDREQQNKR